jgi:hypothetical protein
MRARTIATWAALLLLPVLRPAAARAESLKAHLNGEQLHFGAPDLRFLSPEAQRRLHDGATVIYAFRVSVSGTKSGDATFAVTYHCVFSFDIFEEKYKVSRLEPGYRSSSHLSENAARDLCIDSLAIPVSNVSPVSAFWVSIDYRLEDPLPSGGGGDSRSILDSLVDIFSQRSKKLISADTVRGGPFRLEELRKSK